MSVTICSGRNITIMHLHCGADLRIQDRTDERATNPLADLAQREQKIEAQLKQENQLLLGDLKNWGSSK